MKKLTVTCPECSHEFSPEKALDHHVKHLLEDERAKLQKGFENEFAEKEERLRKFQSDLKQQQLELDVKVEQQVQKQLGEEKEALQKQLKEQLQQENAMELKALREELKQKQELANKAKDTELKLERLQREKEQQAKELEIAFERKLTATSKELEEIIGKRESERVSLKMDEKEKQLSDLRKQLDAANRKANQGSMQLQGEVQELNIENHLRQWFPYDVVTEVKKGANGADCQLEVRNSRGQLSGTLLIESKNTKAFNQHWIAKLREDQQRANADAVLLVSQVLPEGEGPVYVQEGVVICSFEFYPMAVRLLREQLMAVNSEKNRYAQRNDKMALLYDYLTGSEFRMHLEEIIKAFQEQKELLDKERRFFQSKWKKQEKQLEKVLDNAAGMYGSIQGISNNALSPIHLLELPDGIVESD